MSDQSKPWTIRPAVESDIPFIYSTWLRSYRLDSAIGSTCKKSVFFNGYNAILDAILSNPNAVCSVAVSPENSNVIYGYAVYESNAIHYCFVKEAFRRWGIAKSLLQAQAPHLRYYTHRTFSLVPLMSKIDRLDYNPFLIFQRNITSPGENTHAAPAEITH